MSMSAHLFTENTFLQPYLQKYPVAIISDPMTGRGLYATRDIFEDEIVCGCEPTINLFDPTSLPKEVREFLALPEISTLDPSIMHIIGQMSYIIADYLASPYKTRILDFPPYSFLMGTETEMIQKQIKLLREKHIIEIFHDHFQLSSDIWSDDVFSALYTRVKSNAGFGHLQIFTSFMNHSCFPNCMFACEDDAPFASHMKAVTNIPKGSQLFHFYCEGDEELANTFGIHCQWNDPKRALSCSCVGGRMDMNYVQQFHKRRLRADLKKLSKVVR